MVQITPPIERHVSYRSAGVVSPLWRLSTADRRTASQEGVKLTRKPTSLFVSSQSFSYPQAVNKSHQVGRVRQADLVHRFDAEGLADLARWARACTTVGASAVSARYFSTTVVGRCCDVGLVSVSGPDTGLPVSEVVLPHGYKASILAMIASATGIARDFVPVILSGSALFIACTIQLQD